MPTARSGVGAAALDGRIYALGGGIPYLAAIEEYALTPQKRYASATACR